MHGIRRTIVLALAIGVTLGAAALPSTLPGEDGPAAPRATTPVTGGVAAATAAPPDTRSERPTRSPRPIPLAGGPASKPDGGQPVVVAAALRPGSVDRASVEMRTTYDVALKLDFGSRAITVDTRLTATNTSGRSVDRLELNTVAARLGGLRLTSASVDGRTAQARVDDQTIVLPLGGVLEPGASVSARVVYRATLRRDLNGSNWLFTRVNGIANLYRWLPWVSRAVPFDRPNHGDPFVTAVSPRVTVKVTSDRRLALATSGRRISADGLTQTFEARNVRDFTITAAPDYRTKTRTVGDTTIKVWYRAGFPATAALDQAARALSRMSQLVGPYPYRQFNVVQSAGGYGMESPGLIWIPTGVAASNLPYLVHHETAHQWFYGIVGADQPNEPFTDEAAADFLARYALGAKRSSRCATARLDRSIYRYSARCYYEVVYIQGGNFIDGLRRAMGSTRFWRGLRAWIDEHRFGIAPTRSLLETLDAHTPLDLVPRLEPRFPRLY